MLYASRSRTVYFLLSYHVEKIPFPIAHLGKHEVLSSDRTDWCMVPVRAERWAGLKMIILCLGGDKNYLCLVSNICWCSSRLRRGCDTMISKCCCLHWVCANFCWQHKGLCRLKNLSAKPCTTDSSVLAWSGFSGFAWCVFFMPEPLCTLWHLKAGGTLCMMWRSLVKDTREQLFLMHSAMLIEKW